MNEATLKKYTCKDCGETFELTDSEERFFTDRGLFIPKRCTKCLKKKREAKQAEIDN